MKKKLKANSKFKLQKELENYIDWRYIRDEFSEDISEESLSEREEYRKEYFKYIDKDYDY